MAAHAQRRLHDGALDAGVGAVEQTGVALGHPGRGGDDAGVEPVERGQELDAPAAAWQWPARGFTEKMPSAPGKSSSKMAASVVSHWAVPGPWAFM